MESLVVHFLIRHRVKRHATDIEISSTHNRMINPMRRMDHWRLPLFFLKKR
jgi:hypothetical protein